MATRQLFPLILLPLLILALPEPTAHPLANPIAIRHPVVTPSPVDNRPTRTDKQHRRNIISDAESYIGSKISSLGSSIPSYVADGVADFFQAFPSGSAVQSSLGISPDQLAALPTNVLLIPPYANWTEQGWNVRFHGNVYKQPNTSREKLDDLANVFLIDTDINDLPPSQADQARNLTAEIFVVQQANDRPTFNLAPGSSVGASGQAGGGGGVTPPGGFQTIEFPTATTGEGDFDGFVQIASNGLVPGNQTIQTQKLNIFTEGASLGNATAFLYPPNGLTVISDIDDILRITKIYDPAQGLLNSFARPYVPWMNMPEIYANWSTSLSYLDSPVNFHYLTTTPEQVTRNYMAFIYSTYPGGSFDTRPLNFSNVQATLSIRKYLLDRIFETFPLRKFILVADTSNSDVMKDYPQMTKDFPGQVQCIFLRNTSATDSSDDFPYDTSGFEGVPKSMYMFFRVPDDLKGLDIANGQCVNSSVPQDVTFGYQGLPFGINTGNGGSNGAGALMSGRRALALGATIWLFIAAAWAML